MIYIWTRATVDWQDERAFLAQVRPDFRPKVDAWNRTFHMPYHRFRHRIRQIAEMNVSRVEGARTAEWDEIPDGALVIPIDDDDWLAPDVARVLADNDAGATVCHWTPAFLERPIGPRHRLGMLRRAVFPDTPPEWVCATNSYAVVKHPETRPLAESHSRASRWVMSHRPDGVVAIDRQLSLMNRTLASETSLAYGRRSITRARLLWKFHRYLTLYQPPTDPDLAWSAPYVAMMSEVMGELRATGRG